MVLQRKVRISGSSIVIAIPKQFADAYDIKVGDKLNIIPLKTGKILIEKQS